MYTSLVLRKTKADWDAISGIAVLVPGKLQEGVNTQSPKPYAVLTVKLDKEQYKSEQKRVCWYLVQVEVVADDADEAKQIAIETALESLYTASKSGTVGGGAGEPSGSVSYSWGRQPTDRGLQTTGERRAGFSPIVLRKAFVVRVEWA